MYGMVNEAVRGLVLEAFGEEAWHTIHTKAGVTESFVPMQSYDDAVTYGLVGAAQETLDMPAEQILFAFGEYWVLKVATVHYADLMKSSSANFLTFVQNLDHMHQRIRVTFPDYSPPSFRVKVMDDDHFQLDYYSDREGLLPFVEGLFSGLAQHFDVTIDIAHTPDDDHQIPCKRMVIQHRPGR